MVAGGVVASAMLGSVVSEVGLVSGEEQDMIMWEEMRRRSELRRRTVTIVDWDDTLLPSTELIDLIGLERGLPRAITPRFRRKLAEVEEVALRLLNRAVVNGSVVVVTASEQGWVERTSAAYMPRVMEFFRKYSIPIISARHRYEGKCEPIEWKLHTFHDELKALGIPMHRANVLVIGDGMPEVVAARSLQKTHKTMIVKTVKLNEKPPARVLASQLAFVEKGMDSVYERLSSFEVAL